MRFGGVTPIDGMSVVFPGGTCGLIGPNGAGKTTFFNVLSGFVQPRRGLDLCLRREPARLTDFRRARWGLRRTFQTEQAIEKLSIFDNVAMIHEHPRPSARRARATCWTRSSSSGSSVPPSTKVGGLAARAATPDRGGSRRRREAASRAARRAGRRPARRGDRASRPVIRGIPDDYGALVILVDHDMSLVSACCETTAVLDFGKLIASGPTADVLRRRDT